MFRKMKHALIDRSRFDLVCRQIALCQKPLKDASDGPVPFRGRKAIVKFQNMRFPKRVGLPQGSKQHYWKDGADQDLTNAGTTQQSMIAFGIFCGAECVAALPVTGSRDFQTAFQEVDPSDKRLCVAASDREKILVACEKRLYAVIQD